MRNFVLNRDLKYGIRKLVNEKSQQLKVPASKVLEDMEKTLGLAVVTIKTYIYLRKDDTKKCLTVDLFLKIQKYFGCSYHELYSEFSPCTPTLG